MKGGLTIANDARNPKRRITYKQNCSLPGWQKTTPTAVKLNQVRENRGLAQGPAPGLASNYHQRPSGKQPESQSRLGYLDEG